MTDSIRQMIGTEIRQAKRILVVSHLRPDGDAIGSVLGMGWMLLAAGKQVQMVMADGVPSSFMHLAGADLVQNRMQAPVDLAIVLDCSDPYRVGNVLEHYGVPDINIDHHITNLNFARLNLVEPTAVSTTEILASSLADFGLNMNPQAAQALLTGLITDTLGFRTSNITASALRLAADLVDAGANLSMLYRKAQVEKSFEAVRFWGTGLSQLQRDNGLVWTVLTMADRKAAGYSGRDDADLVNVLSAVDSAQVAVILVEQPNRSVKISWRSQPGFDVSGIALSFGGGGHPAASGAEVAGTLEEVQQRVLEATRKLFLVEQLPSS